MEQLPLVIHEQQVTLFKFWFDGTLCDGLRFRNELFRRIYQLDECYRDRVYALSYALTERNIPVIILYSNRAYTVWVNLKVNWQAVNQEVKQVYSLL